MENLEQNNLASRAECEIAERDISEPRAQGKRKPSSPSGSLSPSTLRKGVKEVNFNLAGPVNGVGPIVKLGQKDCSEVDLIKPFFPIFPEMGLIEFNPIPFLEDSAAVGETQDISPISHLLPRENQLVSASNAKGTQNQNFSPSSLMETVEESAEGGMMSEAVADLGDSRGECGFPVNAGSKDLLVVDVSESLGQRHTISSSNVSYRQDFSDLTHSYCNSVTDSGIRNCNKIFWLKNDEFEAAKLWALGKKLGANFPGRDEDIVRRIQDLERRDEANCSEINIRNMGGCSKSK